MQNRQNLMINLMYILSHKLKLRRRSPAIRPFLPFVASVSDAAIAFALLFSAQVYASVFVFAGSAHRVVFGPLRSAHRLGGTGPAGSSEMQ